MVGNSRSTTRGLKPPLYAVAV